MTLWKSIISSVWKLSTRKYFITISPIYSHTHEIKLMIREWFYCFDWEGSCVIVNLFRWFTCWDQWIFRNNVMYYMTVVGFRKKNTSKLMWKMIETRYMWKTSILWIFTLMQEIFWLNLSRKFKAAFISRVLKVVLVMFHPNIFIQIWIFEDVKGQFWGFGDKSNKILI